MSPIRRIRLWRVVFAVVLIGLFGTAVTACGSGKSGPSAKFKARVFSINPESATHIIVSIAITNTSRVKGTASCWDFVKDPANDFSDSPDLSPAIKPHQTTHYEDDVTIADGNAFALTQGQFWATCSADDTATPNPPWMSTGNG